MERLGPLLALELYGSAPFVCLDVLKTHISTSGHPAVRHLGILLDEAGSGALLLEAFVNLVNLNGASATSLAEVEIED